MNYGSKITVDYTPLADVSLDGFQVVKSQYFTRAVAPCMTLWNCGIGFGAAAFIALNKCEYITVMFNREERKVLIGPISSKDPDAVHWVKNPTKPNFTRLECTGLMRPIYEEWGLDPECRYKTFGKVVQCDKRVMILFDFNTYEKWRGKELVREHV